MRQKKDILYLTLPLYHATGLLWSWAGCLRAGSTTVIKEKFSASEFWPDVRKYKATMFGYVGELCRYLMNVMPNEEDQNQQDNSNGEEDEFNPTLAAMESEIKPKILETVNKLTKDYSKPVSYTHLTLPTSDLV